MRLVWCAALACGDNVHLPPDSPRPQVELALVPAQMDGTVLVSDEAFDANGCEVIEGCVGGVGARRVVRFAVVTENLGNADLDLGPTPPPGVSSSIFVWSPCHMHHHVMGYADFELRDGDSVVVTGRKQAFCLEDDEQVTPLGPSHGYNCKLQGISPGWADVYGRDLPCQYIDVTGVPAGTYTLRVAIDATGLLPDGDPSNNEWMTSVTLQ